MALQGIDLSPGVDDARIVSRAEGNTNLYHLPRVASYIGVDTLYLKHEGENPTGSFKDRGMTTGVTQAKILGMDRVACASTGNTSASMASYAAHAGMQGIVFLQNQQIALGKLAQGIAYGATCLQINADFDRKYGARPRSRGALADLYPKLCESLSARRAEVHHV